MRYRTFQNEHAWVARVAGNRPGPEPVVLACPAHLGVHERMPPWGLPPWSDGTVGMLAPVPLLACSLHLRPSVRRRHGRPVATLIWPHGATLPVRGMDGRLLPLGSARRRGSPKRQGLPVSHGRRPWLCKTMRQKAIDRAGHRCRSAQVLDRRRRLCERLHTPADDYDFDSASEPGNVTNELR